METPTSPPVRRFALEIGGMTTVHCVRAVFQALGGVRGAQAAHVALGSAEFVTSQHEDPSPDIRDVIDPLGYTLLRCDPVRQLPVLGDTPG